mgnify:FL=1
MFFCSGVKDTNGRIEVLSGGVKKVLDSTASNNIVENRLLEGNNITISYINEQYHQNPGHGHGTYQGADLEFFVDVTGRRGGKFELFFMTANFHVRPWLYGTGNILFASNHQSSISASKLMVLVLPYN